MLDVDAGLELTVAGRDAPLTFRPRCVIVAGYTARDRADAQRHIDELAEIGVPPPRAVPSFYVMATDILTVADRIVVDGEHTTGEAEPVLLCSAGTWYVGVGSDHTDRQLERDDVGRSKRACAKVISRTVVPTAALDGDWDRMRLRSYTGAERRLYQDGPLSGLMTPEAILDELSARVDVDHDGLVIFLGTVPLIDGGFAPADRFTAELHRPDGEPPLACAYDIVRRGST
jgi:4-hydroxyphenylacetate 3-monooxygenase